MGSNVFKNKTQLFIGRNAHLNINEESSQRVVDIFKMRLLETSSTLKSRPTISISGTTDIGSNQNSNTSKRSLLKEQSYLGDAEHLPICFIHGEPKLHSMTDQRNKEKKTEIYYADAIQRLNNNESQEVAILETSNGLDKVDGRKVGSDHIRSMFGGLSMLADIANTYKLGSFEAMSQVHVHVIRAHDYRKKTQCTRERPGNSGIDTITT
ncbi:hypothetical protein INT45_001039 [Circinella minor]|uniref:Uncharacterized protein n=1 Tax=Circinella minor TaxID=1195481 RepID=A0A8H7SEH5_9FUNG|nr:hypothetical protein INT45_001039 [Circinella minor]